jgi:hypothetical protein
MRISLTYVAVVLVTSITASSAGPGSPQIDQVQAKIDAKLETIAAAGRSARESTAATMHRQPRPESIAAAEANLGDVSPESVQAAEAFMTRARDADGAGDQSACERALAEAQRVLLLQ